MKDLIKYDCNGNKIHYQKKDVLQADIIESKSGSGLNRVCTIRERTNEGKFIKTTFRTNMSIPFHFGISLQSMIVLMGNRIQSDEFQKDVLGYFYVKEAHYNVESHYLQITIELLKCFKDSRYIIFERSGLFPVTILEFIFLSNL